MLLPNKRQLTFKPHSFPIIAIVLLVNPKKIMILVNWKYCQLSHKKMSRCDFRLHNSEVSAATGWVLFYFYINWIEDWGFPRQKLKSTFGPQMGDFKQYMLGIKAGSVNFPLRKIFVGKQQLIVIRLSALAISHVTCRGRPDKVRYSISMCISVLKNHWNCKKHIYCFNWMSVSILTLDQ